MAVFSRIKTWVSNEVLTASDLNAEFNNILTNMQPTGIEDASSDVAAMQATVSPGGVGTESLATDLLGELQRVRYVIKRLTEGAQWYSSPVRFLGTTANTGISSSSGSFSTTSTSDIDVTNLTVTITATGRPVFIGLVGAGGGAGSAVSLSEASGLIRCDLIFFRGVTELDRQAMQFTNSGGSNMTMLLPPSCFWTIDIPSAGSTTYKIQVDGSSGETIAISNIKLRVLEL